MVGQLNGGQALQGGQPGVAPGAQQQPAGLEVAALGGSVQRRLAQAVHRIHLGGGRDYQSLEPLHCGNGSILINHCLNKYKKTH